MPWKTKSSLTDRFAEQTATQKKSPRPSIALENRGRINLRSDDPDAGRRALGVQMMEEGRDNLWRGKKRDRNRKDGTMSNTRHAKEGRPIATGNAFARAPNTNAFAWEHSGNAGEPLGIGKRKINT